MRWLTRWLLCGMCNRVTLKAYCARCADRLNETPWPQELPEK